MIRHFAVQRFCPSSPLQRTPSVTQTQRAKIEIFPTQTFKTNWKWKGGGGGRRKLGYLCKPGAPRPPSPANSGDLPLSLSHSITRTRKQHLCVTTNTLSSTALSDRLSLCFQKKKKKKAHCFLIYDSKSEERTRRAEAQNTAMSKHANIRQYFLPAFPPLSYWTLVFLSIYSS